jgi:hypothetical protein
MHPGLAVLTTFSLQMIPSPSWAKKPQQLVTPDPLPRVIYI